MESRKLPSNEELEALLKLVEEDNFEYEKEAIESKQLELDDVVRFLTLFNITPGKNVIKKSALYSIYRSWSQDPITNVLFSLQVGKYIKAEDIYYNINLSASELSIATIKYLDKNKNDKTKSKNWRIHFDNFLEKFSIKSGNYFIESYMLYYLYDKWTYEIKKKRSLTEKSLSSMLGLYFQKRRTGDKTEWFGVDNSILQHLPPEKQQSIKQARQKRYDKKKGSKKE